VIDPEIQARALDAIERHRTAEPPWPPDDPGPPEPPGAPPERNGHQLNDGDTEPTTWEPVDLGPYLRGEIRMQPTNVGMYRTDGLRLIYPGREHAIIGTTEAGKSWLALGCVAAELDAGNTVVYIHYEEPDAISTVERLQLLGAPADVILARLRFVGPTRPAREGWLDEHLQAAPTLVVHDGINEAMSLHGAEIKDAEGASAFRRRLVVPFLRAGAATLACDHLPLSHDGSRRDAYGSVHKGNALNGARILLENEHPFGRRMRGVSHVYVTKDRPGHLRANGRTTKVPGKTFMGTLVVDDSQATGPDFEMRFYAPTKDDKPPSDTAAELAATVYAVIAALPDRTVTSMRMLLAAMRQAGHSVRDEDVRKTVDDLLVAGLLKEVFGKRGAKGFKAVEEVQT
jgi:hypothetical protein